MSTESITELKAAEEVPASQRVSSGPVPAWVTPQSYDRSFQSGEKQHFTHLLISRQCNAESHQWHHHTAVRLESPEAVRHISQWRLDFEPKIQSVVIHQITLWRGEEQIPQPGIESIRLLDRETGLDHQVLAGHRTILLVLNDVRPGDIIESSYTIENRPVLLADRFSAFFSNPAGQEVGSFFYQIRYRTGRAMRQRCAPEDLVVTETEADGWITRTWAGKKHAARRQEKNVPSWQLIPPWVQFSDCADWAEVARTVAAVWQEPAEDSEVAALIERITKESDSLTARVEKALRFVQDEFRYLSINLELGGLVPHPPGEVLRKRYGDCKDLAFLLVRLLRGLGVSARPILVNNRLRAAVREVLPMLCFDHAIVEFTLAGQTRWVDAVISQQGGGPLNRFLPDYEAGLPIDAQCSGLVEISPRGRGLDRFDIRETILLDTRKAPSTVAVCVNATGQQADSFRREINSTGVEGLAKRRAQIYTGRFGQATRQGTITYRDDRERNIFCFAEIYEIDGFLRRSRDTHFCVFQTPRHLVNELFHVPETEPSRLDDWWIPYPCDLNHRIEVYFSTKLNVEADTRKLDDSFLEFSREVWAQNGCFVLDLQLSVLKKSVPANCLDAYRENLKQIMQCTSWQLRLAEDHPAPQRPAGFGELPPPDTEFDASTGPGNSSPWGARPSASSPEESFLTQMLRKWGWPVRRPKVNLTRRQWVLISWLIWMILWVLIQVAARSH
jgi:transglutaminase-like putative cysteine protease